MTPAAGGSRLVEFAPAKVNLSLQVTGRRSDGYHLLDSLVVFAGVGDELSFEPSPRLELTISGPQAAGLAADASNLVARAASALAKAAGIEPRAAIHLEKRLPVASGIGGGSADAAAAMRGLLSLYGERVAEDELLAIAASLGSDIPVCVASQTAWMEGRGERVTPLPSLPPAHIVLVNPGVSVATADVFRRLTIRAGETELRPPPVFESLATLIGYLKATRNDLEAPALAVAPVIGSVLEALAQQNAIFTRMSGSGATCFGLFESAAKAQSAAAAIAGVESHWWARAGTLTDAKAAEPQPA